MKNILLIGIGRFGKHIALQLNKLGHEVMAVGTNQQCAAVCDQRSNR